MNTTTTATRPVWLIGKATLMGSLEISAITFSTQEAADWLAAQENPREWIVAPFDFPEADIEFGLASLADGRLLYM
jgi:hypothetical protein